jgi:hypothetical protein
MDSSRARKWPAAIVWILVPVLALGGVALRAALVGAGAGDAATVRGVRLGMTPREVRERFAAPGAGQWRAGSEGGEVVLEWSPAGGAAAAEGEVARFEFHSGMLVAVRMVLPASDPDAQGATLGVSSASVMARRGLTNGRVEMTLLARDCPTHAAEVRRLLARR